VNVSTKDILHWKLFFIRQFDKMGQCFHGTVEDWWILASNPAGSRIGGALSALLSHISQQGKNGPININTEMAT
jgi:hypothetical protein